MKSILSIALMVLLYLGVSAAQEILDYTTFVVHTTPLLHEDMSQGDRRAIIRRFCDVMTDFQIRDGDMLYDARQSLFMQVLCGNTITFAPAHDDVSYLLSSDWAAVGLQNRQCNHNQAMMHCDVDRQFTSFIERLFNELFTLQQATIYGWGYNPDTPDLSATAFSQNLLQGVDVCDKSDGRLGSPQTCSVLKSYMRSAHASVDRSIDIIDVASISDIKDTSHNSVSPAYCGLGFTSQRDIVYCGIAGSTAGGSSILFVNLIYNELFYYRLFLGTYSFLLSNYVSYFPRDIQSDRDILQNERVLINDRVSQSLQDIQAATEIVLQTNRDAYSSVSVHIGLSLYYELLQSLRGETVKLVTPLYTLYDKLRNVQEKTE